MSTQQYLPDPTTLHHNNPEQRRRSRTSVQPPSYFQLPGFNFTVREIPSVVYEDDFTKDNFEHQVGRVICPLLSYFYAYASMLLLLMLRTQRGKGSSLMEQMHAKGAQQRPLKNGWYITPEQIQKNNKRPSPTAKAEQSAEGCA